MKIRYFKHTMLVISLTIISLSCDDYLGGDTNVDPNRAVEVSLNVLLPTVIDATALNHYNLGFETSQIVQYVASATTTSSRTDTHNQIRLGTAWRDLYLRALSNASVMALQAAEQESPHYEGVAKIMLAINLSLATDTWGDVPYSEAFQADNNLTPGYDSQESIYTAIQDLLDEAIVALNEENSLFSPEGDDLVYGGDLSQWVKAAYSLKARYALHLSELDTEAASRALTAIVNGFDSNEDDLQYLYDERNLNPWHKRPALADGTGNASITFSEQLIDAMNGTDYGVFDPRLPLIAENDGEAEYTGAINGEEAGESSNSRFTVDTWYSTATAPVLMFTYAESKFIEAEAAFLNNGGTTTSVGSTQNAYDAYVAGISAHMDKLGVDPAERDAYLSDPAVAVGVDGLTLELIMKEKYVANFLHPETWVDFRRYDYDATIYKDLELPLEHNPDLNGEWIRRVLYPLDELSRNGEEVNKVQQGLEVKVWWDR